MVFSNIELGHGVDIDPSASINNIKLGDNVKIAKRVSAFGHSEHPIEVGPSTYIGMNSIVNGYARQLTIGAHVSIAQNVNIMTDSGPNASPVFQRLYPVESGPITIGDHTWIGASAVIMPNVTLGKFCIVGVGSFVTKSFPDYSVIGGTPAKLIRRLTASEIKELES